MAKKVKAKKLSFRQRLRAQSAERLEKIEATMRGAAIRVCEESDTKINPYHVMRLMTGGMTKTLREQLITELANETEDELEAIYNKQIGLDLGDDNGDK
jgi:hypothetical protein